MEKLEAKITRLKAAATLTDMKKEFYTTIAKMLDVTSMSRLEEVLWNRKAREALLESDAFQVEYAGSMGDHDTLDIPCTRWLIKRRIRVRGLSMQSDVPSSMTFEVARYSPRLKNLATSYDTKNGMYLEQLTNCCPLLEEVKLQLTKVVISVDVYGKLVVELGECCRYPNKSFCETTRLNLCAYRDSDWDRAPQNNSVFNWQRFMYSAAMCDAACHNDTAMAMLLIESKECNLSAVAGDGSTALQWSCYHNNTKLVHALLQCDTRNIDAQIKYGHMRTALMWGCVRGNATTIELLLRHSSSSATTLKDAGNQTAFDLLDRYGGALSQQEKSRLKDIHWMNEAREAMRTLNNSNGDRCAMQLMDYIAENGEIEG